VHGRLHETNPFLSDSTTAVFDGASNLLDPLLIVLFSVLNFYFFLLESSTIGGREGGQALKIGPGDRPEVRVDLSWTFPLRYAEVVSGDGRAVYRERIDLSDTPPFGRRTLTLTPNLAGRTWARFEAWDVASDGAFTQPVWLEGK